ncbi:MAG: UDP-N-acetylglucosamine 2-epimerase (non-hydrolyzing) [Chitinivibrionales bacterium]|nr:UDP-N-acetylglucosamine 2-epimerase (non-hydrolyzing) [Chitinivibrionales bacterium]
MNKIITVIGARPQFIKAAPVSKALIKTGGFKEIIVHTGQHYDSNMSDVFFDELEMKSPDYNLEVGSGTHAEQTGEIMKRLEKVLVDEQPGLVLIYGDTNSTAAAALASAKLHIPVAHVEGGMRSFNRDMPEEINRIVADHLSSLHLCSTTTAIANLKNEGITQNVYHVGDVMYDTALFAAQKAKEKSTILEDLAIAPKEYILATIHRQENTDNRLRLENIAEAFGKLSKEFKIILPLHPRTKKYIQEYGLSARMQKVKLVDPVGFLDMASLESNALALATDSGGVQKEAYFHRVPCVTLRDQTEWVETIDAGWNALADTASVANIVSSIRKMLLNEDRDAIADYGDGHAADKIVDQIQFFV